MEVVNDLLKVPLQPRISINPKKNRTSKRQKKTVVATTSRDVFGDLSDTDSETKDDSTDVNENVRDIDMNNFVEVEIKSVSDSLDDKHSIVSESTSTVSESIQSTSSSKSESSLDILENNNDMDVTDNNNDSHVTEECVSSPMSMPML